MRYRRHEARAVLKYRSGKGAMRSLENAAIAFLCCVAASFASSACAEEAIGSAVGLTPAADGSIAGRLDLGSGVFRDETVKTGPSGVLELRFVDQTHLALGSSSSVKLDRFVYGGEGSDSIVIGITRGAFRFAT